MKIVSKEEWNDGTPVTWEVSVHEVPVPLDEWYGRDAKTNEEYIEEGAILRAFVVDEVLATPDEERSNDEDEPIAGCEFQGVAPGDVLVLFMNLREYVEKTLDKVDDNFSQWPMLINIQDVGFNVELVEE